MPRNEVDEIKRQIIECAAQTTKCAAEMQKLIEKLTIKMNGHQDVKLAAKRRK